MGKLIWAVLVIAYFLGWCRCIYKLTQCNFNAPYKAEVFYTVGVVTSLGGVIGWFDIKD